MPTPQLMDLITFIEKDSCNTVEKGQRFEKIVKTYLETSKKFIAQFDKIWLWRDFPYNDGLHDAGIDIVARYKSGGGYCSFQCKFYDENAYIDKSEIDSFISATGKSFFVDGVKSHFEDGVIVTTSSRWSSVAEDTIKNQKIPIRRLSFADFLQDEEIDWANFYVPKNIHKKKVLRPHQQEAVNCVIKGFETADRGKLIMACGTGKTFTSLKIAEKIASKGGKVLFLMPSIALMSQTITEWIRENELGINFYAVCSDSRVAENGDSSEYGLSDFEYPASTSVASFKRRFEKFDPEKMQVIFSTYQSIDVVSLAQKELGFEFDIIICDEAHRTTGAKLDNKDNALFSKVHDADFIKSKHRLYMTATPRIYTDSVKNKAKDELSELCSMDDEAIYGKEFYRLSFGKSVELGLLSDYKVLVIAVNEAYAKKIHNEKFGGDTELNVTDIGKLIGCWKGLSKDYGKDMGGDEAVDAKKMQRAVSFISKIADSKGITSLFRKLQEKKFDKNLVDIEIDHVDGKMNSIERNKRIDVLKKGKDDGCKILSNARCLSEGVDVPSLDAVMFLSPRNSEIDIIQSVGRVMRKSEGKTFGYIILPVVIAAHVDPKEALDKNKEYQTVWKVLNALRAHDERYNVNISKLDLEGKKPENIETINIGLEEGKVTVHELEEFETGTNFDNFEKALFAKIVKVCGSKEYISRWAGDVADIAKRNEEIINNLLDSNEDIANKFAKFVTSLWQNINDNITRRDATEMVSQHLITKPVFDALFKGTQWAADNPVSKAMDEIVGTLSTPEFQENMSKLDEFYENVRIRIDGIDSYAAKQKIIITLYDEFFRKTSPKLADKHGVVYTPVEVVDFIIRSVQSVLKREFGKSFSNAGVNIIDPFTGTGTFIVRLLQSGYISKERLLQKYKNEIFANEIMLLPYYIAAVNIEMAFHEIVGGKTYQNFEGIVLTDTFAINEKDGNLEETLLPENNQRIIKQKGSKIQVIIGNPPYSAGQKKENDGNKNIKYPKLDNRIKETYAKFANAQLLNSLYDSYIRAFRWSSDRVGDEGVIGFITNANYIDNNAMSGFRKMLGEEFSKIYVFNLKGAIRGKSGEAAKKEGQNVFDIMTGVAIIILIKNKDSGGKGEVNYYEIGDYLNRISKLETISNLKFEKIPWKKINPNDAFDWINKRNDAFSEFIPLGDKNKENTNKVFSIYSNGVKTQRDSWCYNFNKTKLLENMGNMIDFYNSEVARYAAEKSNPAVEGFINNDPTKISWTRQLKKDLRLGKKITLVEGSKRPALYRPFCKQYLYFDRRLNEEVGLMFSLFPTQEHENVVIITNGVGSPKDFTSLISNTLPDLEVQSKNQCFPLYYYTKNGHPDEEKDSYGYVRRSAITDYIFNECVCRYGELTREDIFYYVYGLLHSEDYRTTFTNDLKKMLARLPLVKTTTDFWAFSKAGRELSELHLNYETLPLYPAKVNKPANPNYTVKKMGFYKKDKSKIIYNSQISIEDVPLDAYNYIVNGKSAVEWVMDRYSEREDRDSKIINNPNDYSEDKEYILNLLLRVITLSLETLKITNRLPKLNATA